MLMLPSTTACTGRVRPLCPRPPGRWPRRARPDRGGCAARRRRPSPVLGPRSAARSRRRTWPSAVAPRPGSRHARGREERGASAVVSEGGRRSHRCLPGCSCQQHGRCHWCRGVRRGQPRPEPGVPSDHAAGAPGPVAREPQRPGRHFRAGRACSPGAPSPGSFLLRRGAEGESDRAGCRAAPRLMGTWPRQPPAQTAATSSRWPALPARPLSAWSP